LIDEDGEIGRPPHHHGSSTHELPFSVGDENGRVRARQKSVKKLPRPRLCHRRLKQPRHVHAMQLVYLA
jgi:hypothetical protein